MIVGQITDLHVGFDPELARDANLRRLAATVDALAALPQRPDLLLVTGDLTEHGDAAATAAAAAVLDRLPMPAWPIPGNHDARATLLAAFPEVAGRAGPDGFVQYAIENDRWRVLMLDTLEEGRHGGGFCDARAGWLAAALAARPATPTLIAMHHPPFAAGVPWMDTAPAEPWVARFAAALAGHDQVEAILCGHVHRAAATSWRGRTALIAPSVAPAVGLDFAPIDPDRPDGRALIVNTAPGYALHRWAETTLVSHFAAVVPAPVLARYDAALQPMVRGMLAERPDAGHAAGR